MPDENTRVEIGAKGWNLTEIRLFREKKFLGNLDIAHNGPEWRVAYSYAKENGWGPLLYEIALELAGRENATLTSDTSVSNEAAYVWDKYEKRPDVDRSPRTRTIFPDDDDSPRQETSLQHAYVKRDDTVLRQLEQNGQLVDTRKVLAVKKAAVLSPEERAVFTDYLLEELERLGFTEEAVKPPVHEGHYYRRFRISYPIQTPQMESSVEVLVDLRSPESNKYAVDVMVVDVIDTDGMSTLTRQIDFSKENPESFDKLMGVARTMMINNRDYGKHLAEYFIRTGPRRTSQRAAQWQTTNDYDDLTITSPGYEFFPPLDPVLTEFSDEPLGEPRLEDLDGAEPLGRGEYVTMPEIDVPDNSYGETEFGHQRESMVLKANWVDDGKGGKRWEGATWDANSEDKLILDTLNAFAGLDVAKEWMSILSADERQLLLIYSDAREDGAPNMMPLEGEVDPKLEARVRPIIERLITSVIVQDAHYVSQSIISRWPPGGLHDFLRSDLQYCFFNRRQNIHIPLRYFPEDAFEVWRSTIVPIVEQALQNISEDESEQTNYDEEDDVMNFIDNDLEHPESPDEPPDPVEPDDFDRDAADDVHTRHELITPDARFETPLDTQPSSDNNALFGRQDQLVTASVVVTSERAKKSPQ